MVLRVGTKSGCLNALYDNWCGVLVCVDVCFYIDACGVWCHHSGSVVVDFRLHTPGKSVITQSSAHTHTDTRRHVACRICGPRFLPTLNSSFTQSIHLSPELSQLGFGHEICILCFELWNALLLFDNSCNTLAYIEPLPVKENTNGSV